MTPLEATEAECAEGRTAPRVSLDDIKANIALETYFRALDAVYAEGRNAEGEGTYGPEIGKYAVSLKCLTICIVVLKNGFTVIGKSAPASPANFDAGLGQRLAYEDALRQVWPLMGYALREKLAVT